MRVVGVASLDSGLCFESAAGPGGLSSLLWAARLCHASRYGLTSGVDRVATIVVPRGSWRLYEDEAYARAMQAEEHALMEQIAATVTKRREISVGLIGIRFSREVPCEFRFV